MSLVWGSKRKKKSHSLTGCAEKSKENDFFLGLIVWFESAQLV